MESIENQQFGRFVSQLRKEKGLTQRELAVLVLFPLVYLLTNLLAPVLWQRGELWVTLAATLSILIPVYVCGKKYE